MKLCLVQGLEPLQHHGQQFFSDTDLVSWFLLYAATVMRVAFVLFLCNKLANSPTKGTDVDINNIDIYNLPVYYSFSSSITQKK